MNGRELFYTYQRSSLSHDLIVAYNMTTLILWIDILCDDMLRENASERCIRLLPDNKILSLSELKAFADENCYVDEIVHLSIMGKEENTGDQHFLQCF